MQDKAVLIRGWVQAFVAILVFLGINTVMGRYSAVVLEVNPVIYSCAAFVSCALVLLIRAGHGPLAKESMRSVDTWVYGAILMMSYIIGMLLFSHVTSTEGTMLQKISVLLGLLGSWFFLGRQPDRYQILGVAVITIGVVLVCNDLNSEDLGVIYLLAFLYGALQVSRIFVAELHRPHAKAAQDNDPKSRARVVGFVMFVISTLFLFGTLLISLAQEAQQESIEALPTLADFIHAPTIFAGMIAGVIIVAPSRILEFSSSNIIKAENFTTVTSLSFVSTLFWEWATSPLTGLSLKAISNQDLLAGALITFGGLFIALTRGHSKKTPKWQEELFYAGQDPQMVEDSREILANTLEHYDSDFDKSAKALSVHIQTIQALVDDKQKTLAFKPDVLKEVARAYRKKVAMSDALTGLANRAGFMTTLKGAPYEADKFSLLYIDLDKFKPVNDTYGHEAGDAVLKAVAERMTEMFPFRALPTRLGGDEFAVLVLDADREKAETLAKELKAKVIEPITFDGQEIAVGASVGIACFPEDGTDGEKLLKIADGGMYAEKGEGGSSR